MSDLTKQLDRIGAEILQLLQESGKPLTQTQLHLKSNLGLAPYGWSFALEKLEKKHLVEFIPPYFWALKDETRKLYINIIEEMGSTNLDPD